jgi:spore germination protein KB
MAAEERISTRQLATLLIYATIGDMLLVLPPVIADATKQDAWIASLFGLIVGLALASILFLFGKMLGDKGLIEQNRMMLGSLAGGIVSVLYLLYFLLNSAVMVRETADFLTTVLFPETPLRAIHGLAVIVLVFGVKAGIQSIARTGEVFLPIFGFLYMALVLLLLPQVQSERLHPIMAASYPELLRGTMMAAIYPFCELCVILMIMPSVTKRKHMARDYGVAVAIGGLCSFAIVLLSILVLGGTMTAHYNYPAYILSGKISIGHFVERLEAILAVNLILLTFMKTVMYFYAFVLGTAQLFKLGDYRPLAFPTGMIVFGLAFIIWPNVVYYKDYLFEYWADADVVVGLLLPLALAGLYKWKAGTKRGKPAKA